MKASVAEGCRFKGPYYPVGDVDWVCVTHNVLLELRDPAAWGLCNIGRADLYCPKAGLHEVHEG